MSNVLVNDEYLKAIGDAIREKNGTVLKYKPSEMAAQIKNISSGSGSADFSSVFNFKKVTIDPALHAKSVKISLLDGDNELTIIHNDDLGIDKSSFKIEPTLESGYLPSNIYTAKIDSTNDALYVTGEACTAPPQFPSKYVMAKQNFTVEWTTRTHADLADDKLFSSIDIATDSIKLNLKSDVSISNLTFSNKKKLTIELKPKYSSSSLTGKECIGETTFDSQNKCIIIDKTNGLSNNFNELDTNCLLINLYLKDSDFKILNEEMKITDYTGTDRDTVKFFYLSEKELAKTFLADIGDAIINNNFKLMIEKIKTNAGSYFFLILPLVGEGITYAYYFSAKDNKLMEGIKNNTSMSYNYDNTYNCYYIEYIREISNYDGYTANKSDYYDFSELNEISDLEIFETLYFVLKQYYKELSKNYYGDNKTDYDKQINDLGNKTDSEKQTLVENAKTNFLSNLTFRIPSSLYSFSGGFSDENVTKLFSIFIFEFGMYTLKNPPTVNWKFEVDV